MFVRRLAQLLTTCLVLTPLTAVPATSADWRTVAWSDMRKLAPAGSVALGRTYTVAQVQKTCQMLSRGVAAEDIIDSSIMVAMKSARDLQQQQDMVMFSMSAALVAVKRLCPAYTADVWSAINR